jgi:predicted ATP-dependent endonuclease of OLD family
MKIEEIYLKDCGPIDELQLIFKEPGINYFGDLNISILVGENGVGKTTILKLLAYAFFPELHTLTKNYSSFLVQYSIKGETWTAGKNNMGNIVSSKVAPSKVIISSFAVFEQFSLTQKLNASLASRNIYNSQEDIQKTKYCYCGPMSSIGRSSARKNNEMILNAFFGEYSNSYRATAIKSLMEIIGFQGEPLIELNMVSRPPDDNGRSAMQKNVEYLESSKNRDDFNRLKRELKQLSIRYEDSFIIDMNNISDSIISELKSYQSKGAYLVKDLWFRKESKIVPISKMSSGEITMFYRFFPLIQSVEDGCVIIIDEPETHLHPKWVRGFIYNLYKLFNQFKAHIIIASHSPMIVADVPKDCIIGLHKVESKISQYDIKERTLGGEPADILCEVFRLHDYKGKFTGKKLEEILYLAQNKQFERAIQIYDDLGTTTYKYDLFEKISKYIILDEEI